MMINKRLLNLVPKSKKYVFITVGLKLISLISNFILVFSVASIIEKRGLDAENFRRITRKSHCALFDSYQVHVFLYKNQNYSGRKEGA